MGIHKHEGFPVFERCLGRRQCQCWSGAPWSCSPCRCPCPCPPHPSLWSHCPSELWSQHSRQWIWTWSGQPSICQQAIPGRTQIHHPEQGLWIPCPVVADAPNRLHGAKGVVAHAVHAPVVAHAAAPVLFLVK